MTEIANERKKTKSMPRIKRIIKDIGNYVDKYGGEYAEWRIGLRKSSCQQFLDMQFVMFKSHLGIIRQSASPSEAKEVIDHFVEKCRMALDIPEIDCDGDMVYVYKDSALAGKSSPPQQLTLFSDIFNEIKSRGGAKFKSLPKSRPTVIAKSGKKISPPVEND